MKRLLGELHWTKPAWLARLLAWITASRLAIWVRSNPRRGTAVLAGGAVALVALVYGGYRFKLYLDTRPEPDYVEVQLQAPTPTNPETKTPDTLIVTFSESAARMDLVGKDVTPYVHMSPQPPGNWLFTTDKNLVFALKDVGGAKSDWAIGQTYRISFDRKLFAPHLLFRTNSFEVKTEPLKLAWSKASFYVDPTNPKIKRVVGTVSSNYPLNAESFRKHVSLSFGGDLAFSVTYNAFFTQAHVQSEPITVPNDDKAVTLTVDKGVRPGREGPATTDALTDTVTVPGLLTGFKLTGSNVIFARNERYEPEQVLVLESSFDARTEELEKNLEVFLLPAAHRPPGSRKVVANYNWSSASEITPEVRKQLVPVALKLVPSENTYSRTHAFKVDVPVERSLYIHVKKGVRALGDYQLADDYNDVARAPDFTRELMFMSKGSILSFSGDRKLPLLARNVDKVTFEIARIIPAQVNHLIWRVLMDGNFSNPAQIAEIEAAVSERFTAEQKLPFRSRAETIYFSLDLEPYLKDQRGFFFVRARTKTGESDTRLVLVSDLGVIAKQATGGGTDLFVQNFRTGAPVGEAEAQVIGRNGIAVLSLPTDGQGHAQLPPLKDYKNEKAPLAFVVRKGADVSYLPYEMGERQLMYSRFDIGGVYESSESDQLTAMLFSDRGIYRPGEKASLGLIVRGKKWSGAAPKVPLVWTVTDPRGNVIKEERFEQVPFGLAELGFSTQETSPTGIYQVRVQIIKRKNDQEQRQQLGSLGVKVEEFVPDTMKVAATIDPHKEKGWVTAGKVTATIALKNLYGTPAENRKVKAEVVLTPVAPTVPQLRDYTFANLNKKEAQTVRQTFDERRTNAQGEVTFDVDLSQYDGFFHMRLESEGFDAGSGRGVVAVASQYVSHFPILVGFRADGDLHYINRGAARAVQLVAVDPGFALTHATGLKLKLVERKYVSALLKQDDGTYKYQSVRRDRDLKIEDLTIPKAGLALNVPSEQPGDFTYVVTDSGGRELNHMDFSVVAEENLSRSLDRSAELQLALNKSDYRPGEEIEMQIKAPYKGAGLITIERDQVYAFKWFKTTRSSTVERIRIPEGLEGNAYVNVTYLRAMDSKEIFMSPLSYGVQPFFISLDQQRTKIRLSAPEKVKPGERLRIHYSTDRPTSLVLYGVNEGILQVAHYALPDPLQFFFRKKALQVRTFQLLDLLLPEYSLLKEMSTPSSDKGFDSLGKNLNPFRRKGEPPVAFWSGVLKAGPGEKTYEYVVPDDFNGNLKIMAVASDPKGLGATSTATLSRGDFVISPSVPAFVAPGDEFTVAVNVANQLEGHAATSHLRVVLESGPQFEVVGGATQTLEVDPGHEKTADFKLRVLSKLGAADLKFTVTGGQATARIASHLSVRPAMPYGTTVTAGLVRDLPLELGVDRKLVPEYRQVELGLSYVPLSLAHALVSYLADYPYLCTEQLVSKAATVLVYRELEEKDMDARKAAEEHEKIIAVLRMRQTPEGGFSLYGHERSSAGVPSLHAIEYLLEARANGFAVPDELIERAQVWLRSAELRKVSTLSEVRMFAHALYLQTLSGYVPTNDLGFLLEALEKSFKGKWEKDATAIYLAGAYSLLKQEDKGRALVSGLRLGEYNPNDYVYYQDGLVRDALLLRITAHHYPALLKKLFDYDAATKFVGQIRDNGFNSYSSAQALMAIAAIVSNGEKAGGLSGLVVKALHAPVSSGAPGSETLAVGKGTAPRVAVPPGTTKLLVEGEVGAPLFYALTQKGFDAELPKSETKSRLELGREYLSAAGTSVDKVKIGDEVDVSLRARMVDGKFAGDLALVDLYPAGFELVAPKRPEGGESPETAPAVENNDDETRLEPRWKPGPATLWSLEKLFSSPLAWAEEAALKAMSIVFADFREDRVVVYANASPKLGEFRYRLKAISRGKYVVPPVFGESMYDRSIHYRGAAKTLEVY